MASHNSVLDDLLAALPVRHAALRDRMETHPLLAAVGGGWAPRAVIAQALNVALLGDLADRSPLTAAYLDDLRAANRRLRLDHGALRTVDLADMGRLPRGEAAITRVLEPLGYARAGEYPLTRLRMTGRSYSHVDLPEAIPQFFISELHVAQFSAPFQVAAAQVTASSRDPLDAANLARLEELRETRTLPLDEAQRLLPALVACFARHHDIPAIEDYETLAAESAEMAWIATEGNVFNHGADRVTSLEAVVDEQRRKGRPVKDAIEVSRNGQVRQTALHADPVEREFRQGNALVSRTVPGSFFEFIERDRIPGAVQLDLSFDSGNAQGIFKMTEAA